MHEEKMLASYVSQASIIQIKREWKEGRKEGKKEGRKEGREGGRKEGEKEGRGKGRSKNSWKRAIDDRMWLPGPRWVEKWGCWSKVKAFS